MRGRSGGTFLASCWRRWPRWLGAAGDGGGGRARAASGGRRQRRFAGADDRRRGGAGGGRLGHSFRCRVGLRLDRRRGAHRSRHLAAGGESGRSADPRVLLPAVAAPRGTEHSGARTRRAGGHGGRPVHRSGRCAGLGGTCRPHPRRHRSGARRTAGSGRRYRPGDPRPRRSRRTAAGRTGRSGERAGGHRVPVGHRRVPHRRADPGARRTRRRAARLPPLPAATRLGHRAQDRTAGRIGPGHRVAARRARRAGGGCLRGLRRRSSAAHRGCRAAGSAERRMARNPARSVRDMGRPGVRRACHGASRPAGRPVADLGRPIRHAVRTRRTGQSHLAVGRGRRPDDAVRGGARGRSHTGAPRGGRPGTG